MPKQPTGQPPRNDIVPLSDEESHGDASDAWKDVVIDRYRRVLNRAVGTAIITIDQAGIVTGWNRGAQEIIGWTEREMLGQSLGRIFPEDEGGSAMLGNEIAHAMREGAGGAEGWRLRKNGDRFWAIGEVRPLSNRDPGAGFVKILRDRTEHRTIETELIERTRALEILNRAGAALARESEFRVIVQTVTDAGVALTGAQFGAFFLHGASDQGRGLAPYAVAGVAGEALPTLELLDGMKGAAAGFFVLSAPVVSRSGSVLGTLCFGHRDAEAFDDCSEQILGGLTGEAAVAIDNVRLFDEAQREIAERRRAEAALLELNAGLEEQVQQRTRELIRNEEVLRQAQKMEAIGQLTGGVAHDFNNLLQVIVGNLEILSRGLSDGAPRLQRAVTMAMSGAKRAGALTQRLLAFARRQPLNPKPLNANRVVQETSELLRRSLGEMIHLEAVLGGGLWLTEVDPSALESALLNLAVNARDAMPEGGKLTIETANAHLDENYAARHAEVNVGQYVSISVTDTGIGMDAQTLSRAFEPFFTTKEEGKGTGLGLSQVYGFVKQSAGHVKLYSEIDNGTTVRIYLPRWMGSNEVLEERDTSLLPKADGETILVVEDDADVRAYSVAALEELGYRVIEASNGKSALEVLERREVDLLFCDVVLPGGMTGAQVVAKARELRPGIKALFTTGYARNAIVHHGRLDPGVNLITKPFTFDALAKKVRDVLDG